jgi:hypothetical protein
MNNKSNDGNNIAVGIIACVVLAFALWITGVFV